VVFAYSVILNVNIELLPLYSNKSFSDSLKRLACCDTFHDFKGGERGKKAKNEEGDSLNLSFVGINYAEFAKETINRTLVSL
jgi:hypothetical protein